MHSLDIYCNDLIKNDESSVRSCTIESKDGKRITSSKILKYELPHDILLPEDNDAEAYIIATILLAMAENRTLKIHGSVSRTLLSNLTEFRDAWNCWLPDIYHKIDFEATIIDDSIYTNNNEAIAAFSGGLDSTFTVWQHSQKLAGYRTQNIKACMFVHGFDIFRREEYDSAFNVAQKTLASIDIPLFPIRTNYRSIIEQNWSDTHGIALTACINNFKNIYSIGIIAGSFPYNYNIYPHGSNPITDPLLSSSSSKIIHDGGQFVKHKKALGISDWKIGVQNLRVCYSAEQRNKNCGACFKCIQTNLYFESNNIKRPKSIPIVKNGKVIRQLIIRRPEIAQYFIDALKFAKTNSQSVNYKWSYYYMLYKSKIIREILKVGYVRLIGKKLYNTLFKN